MLRTVTHDADRRMWCGPTAISAVTGAPTSKVFALADADRQARIDKGTWSIMGRSRSRSVKGMAHGELVNVLRALGHRVTLLVSNTTGERVPLGDFIRQHHRSDTAYIVAVRGHYLAVSGFMVVDSHSGGWPVWCYDRKRAMRQRVVWAVAVDAGLNGGVRRG